MSRAKTPFPVPDSPSISTGEGARAICARSWLSCWIDGDRPGSRSRSPGSPRFSAMISRRVATIFDTVASVRVSVSKSNGLERKVSAPSFIDSTTRSNVPTPDIMMAATASEYILSSCRRSSPDASGSSMSSRTTSGEKSSNAARASRAVTAVRTSQSSLRSASRPATIEGSSSTIRMRWRVDGSIMSRNHTFVRLSDATEALKPR